MQTTLQKEQYRLGLRTKTRKNSFKNLKPTEYASSKPGPSSKPGLTCQQAGAQDVLSPLSVAALEESWPWVQQTSRQSSEPFKHKSKLLGFLTFAFGMEPH